MAIKKWDKNLRPREKAINNGIESLSDYELLALILRCGNKEKDAIELSKEILQKSAGLSNLLDMSLSQLMKIEGIGKIKLGEGQKYCRIDVIAETGTVRTYMIYFDEETKEEYTKIPEENSETEETSSVIENNKQNIFFTVKNIIIILAIILILVTVFLLVKKKKRKKGKHY